MNSLLILIPHRDCGRLLWDYRRGLFRAGFPGAYSFPAAAPLALCPGPLPRQELKELARELRERSRRGEGIFRVSGAPAGESLELLPGLRMAGFPLAVKGGGAALIPGDLDFFKGNRGLTPYPRLLLSAGLTDPALPSPALPPPPALSFRAAQVAGCRFFSLPLGERAYSAGWEIEDGVWLPP